MFEKLNTQKIKCEEQRYKKGIVNIWLALKDELKMEIQQEKIEENSSLEEQLHLMCIHFCNILELMVYEEEYNNDYWPMHLSLFFFHFITSGVWSGIQV